LNVAILSGKGGTGKTIISTNLALSMKANYIDCDVEEPNGFLFLKPEIDEIEKVMVEYPFIEQSTCISCGACVDVCQFHALAKVKDDMVLFQKLCHGCGACELICKAGAISYKQREIGTIEKAYLADINCSRGILNVGEPIAVPVIRQLLEKLTKGINLIDCPPGTSCNVVTSLKYVDSAILVTEPSEFGLHDLKLAIELVKMYNIPFGVIINKDDSKENIVTKYCNKEQIDIIGKIAYSRDIAWIYSRGENLWDNLKYKEPFDELWKRAKVVLKWS
jgi:MinD superfamily P-loop ATPase